MASAAMGWDDPVNLVPLSILLFCLIRSGLPRSAGAWWVIFNAVIIHAWLDGIVGSFLRGPDVLVEGYKWVDERFTNGDATVAMVCRLELFVYTPIAVVWYHAENNNLWYRDFMAILLSTIHMTGNAFYCFVEAFEGFPNVPVDWPPKFDTRDKILKFWGIFVGANLVWVVIPMWLLWRSWTNQRRMLKQNKRD